MATVMAVTSLQLGADEKKNLVQKIGEAVCDSFALQPQFKSIMLLPSLDGDSVCESAADQITFFVFTAPNKTADQKRALVKALNGVMLDAVGHKGDMKVIVIIKEHTDENVGVDGSLKLDL